MNRDLLITPLLLLCCSCAVLNPDNRPLVNWVEENLVPESTGGRIAAAPVVLPIGLVAGVLDAFVVHPISVIDDSYNDTMDALWRDSKLEYVTQCGSLPFKVLSTPIVFTVDFVGRSVFDIPERDETRRRTEDRRRAEEEKAAERQRARAAVFTTHFLSGVRSERMAALQEFSNRGFNSSDWQETRYVRLVVEACAKFPDDTDFCAAAIEAVGKHVVNHAAECVSGDDQSEVERLIGLAGRLGRSKDKRLRLASLPIVRDFAFGGSTAGDLSVVAQPKCLALYDFYVAEGDHVAEMACCHVPTGIPTRDMDLRFAERVALSLGQRGSPAYGALLEFQCQRKILEQFPELTMYALENKWRAVSGVRLDWADRVIALLKQGESYENRQKLAAELTTDLQAAKTAAAKETNPEKRIEQQRTISGLLTQITAIEFLDKVAEMSPTDFAALRESVGGTFAQPAKRTGGQK